MEDTERTRQVLLGMKERLSSGWGQGELNVDSDPCLYGAFVGSAGIPCRFSSMKGQGVKGRHGPGNFVYTFRLETPEGQAIALIAQALDVDFLDLALWNDDPARTHAEIVAVIDSALALLAEKERETVSA